ncbi:hypothetical protein MUK42_35587, partial [Musa troglodytarum]
MARAPSNQESTSFTSYNLKIHRSITSSLPPPSPNCMLLCYPQPLLLPSFCGQTLSIMERALQQRLEVLKKSSPFLLTHVCQPHKTRAKRKCFIPIVCLTSLVSLSCFS